ncbi:hypothetical protein COO60DRAFT_390801 [Scenedesmus sp. NREL 46B-D3]|nr:hypothetical protein COO60DRAFT_390801 [Scenedesmus sp. NREL 46B-D3]
MGGCLLRCSVDPGGCAVLMFPLANRLLCCMVAWVLSNAQNCCYMKFATGALPAEATCCMASAGLHQGMHIPTWVDCRAGSLLAVHACIEVCTVLFHASVGGWHNRWEAGVPNHGGVYSGKLRCSNHTPTVPCALWKQVTMLHALFDSSPSFCVDVNTQLRCTFCSSSSAGCTLAALCCAQCRDGPV